MGSSASETDSRMHRAREPMKSADGRMDSGSEIEPMRYTRRAVTPALDTEGLLMEGAWGLDKADA